MCRAFLSPWFERGGYEPADENDTPVFIGRFNLGAISLNLPMILAKAQQENKDFYEVLNYYMEMIRGLHIRTYDYIGEMRASVNPLMYCHGGFYGGHLDPNDKIRPLLKTATMSFGFTALNELQQLYNKKSIYEDGEFAIEVMEFINDKINQYKKEDHIMYAIYGTPAESLCFSGDTEVQCHGGNKQIKDIKVGDLVYSYNEDLKKIELKEVVRSMKTIENAKVVKVSFDNGQSVVCTPNHPFAVEDKNIVYCEASKLCIGATVKSDKIGDSNIEDISIGHKVVSVEHLDYTVDVYDIEVADNHNFYVGGNDGILVHNCGTQVKQFRAKYGIIPGVSDKEYFTNSFHCHVTEDLTPTEKQDSEKRFWNLANGGKIQYVRYRSEKNLKAIETLIDRAMSLGFYEGINMDKDFCLNCGYKAIDFTDGKCPICGSDDIVEVNRVCGYLGYSKVHGKSRMNDAKLAEVKDRVSM